MVKIIHDDCVAVLAEMDDDTIDAVVCDPPYELGFMAKAWDKSGIANAVELWRSVLRVLKPGGHLLAFGGTRTHHRMTCAIEDAGFEIRDELAWIYGTGFPKSLNIAKAIDKRREDDPRPVCRFLRAALDRAGVKVADVASVFRFHPRMVEHWAARDSDSQPTVPTWEQWEKLKELLGFGDSMDAEVRRLNERKGTVGEAYLEAPVVGMLSNPSRGGSVTTILDGAKDQTIRAPNSDDARRWEGWGTALKPAREPIILAKKPGARTLIDTVLEHGTGGLNIDATRIGSDRVGWGGGGGRGAVDRGTWNGDTCGLQAGEARPVEGRWPANVLFAHLPDCAEDCAPGCAVGELELQASGASRFFYVAKANRKERDLGCEDLPTRSGGEATDREDGSAGLKSPRAGAGRTGGVKNHHATVKPVQLMRYLVRLVTPPNGVVLDPFLGSGTTGIAAVQEGFNFIGIEQEQEYIEIATARIKHAIKEAKGA